MSELVCEAKPDTANLKIKEIISTDLNKMVQQEQVSLFFGRCMCSLCIVHRRDYRAN